MSKAIPIIVLLLVVAWISLHRDEAQLAAGSMSGGSTHATAEPAVYYFPEGFAIKPNESEPKLDEYY
jgi:hypothetical protein